jgi:hypothetical protein
MFTILILFIRTALHALPNLAYERQMSLFQLEYVRTKARKLLPWSFIIVVALDIILKTFVKFRGDWFETAPDLISWLFWLAVIIAVIFTIFSIDARPILTIATIIFVISIAINVFVGHSFASKIRQQHANTRIHLMDSRETKVVGILVLLVANGVVLLPSLLCKPPPPNSGIRFISWEAIKLVENIPPRKCSPS